MKRSYIAYKERSRGAYIAKYTIKADAIINRHFGMLPMLWEIQFKINFLSTALLMLDWRIAITTIALLT